MSTQALQESDGLPSLPPNARSTALLSETPAPKHDLSEQNVSRACDEFSSLLGHERVVSNPTECFAHSNTPWSPAPPSHTPALVLLPATTSDVSAIMKICSRRRIPVTAFCGGTSFSGALTATRGGVCIDFQRMSQVLAVHADDMDVVVQPAVGWQELNAQLASLGLFFPPDPGPGAKIGGMVGLRLTLQLIGNKGANGSADCYGLLWYQCIPTRHDARMGDFCNCCAGGRYCRQNPAQAAKIVRWVRSHTIDGRVGRNAWTHH